MKSSNADAISISPIRAFSDNYIWCLHDTQFAAVVDPGDPQPVIAFLAQNNLNLVSILITHHHFDHTGGIQELVKAYPNVEVFGPHNPKISGITTRLKEKNSIKVPQLDVQLSILETPGHTLDHIVYYNDELLFCGDTLFSGGCGRMFEGTAGVFYTSLQKLAALPAHTKVYCTHEYTQANIRFASSIEPNNKRLQEYADWVATTRAKDEITLPSTIKRESEINPFLRCHIQATQSKFDRSDRHHQKSPDKEVATFAALRELKDNF